MKNSCSRRSREIDESGKASLVENSLLFYCMYFDQQEHAKKLGFKLIYDKISHSGLVSWINSHLHQILHASIDNAKKSSLFSPSHFSVGAFKKERRPSRELVEKTACKIQKKISELSTYLFNIFKKNFISPNILSKSTTQNYFKNIRSSKFCNRQKYCFQQQLMLLMLSMC